MEVREEEKVYILIDVGGGGENQQNGEGENYSLTPMVSLVP